MAGVRKSEPASDVPRRIVRCPRCGGPSVYAPSNPSRPFCSERCRSADFGAWASESYRVAPATAPDEEEERPRDDD